MAKSGIYKILNKVNGKFYIGSAVDFTRRFNRHKRLLNSNEHPNGHLQAAWLKYWNVSFEFVILEECDKENLICHEQHYLDLTECWNREVGYNICKIADNRTGVFHSKETKALMSKNRKGLTKSPEWQAKITAAITGKKRNPSIGKAQSQRLKGRKDTEEASLNKSKGQIGRKHSDESKRKRSEALKGRVIRPKEVQSNA